ncbi:LacI family transcriptional regulator [Sansalvadorimonas sp. 2012CJ34-2]|uniref:LacI family transcriptional regulator n=1 Tax=Parendozoicomonas callyspongiae TaxID=2942213 RepID=A0ABT0PGN2_9GAMM|nr:LacI family DNA-binding transcriptional regulator [Sansalvadorimonas sp. 2012CJ34-2]MCL6270503.1 LacI family transcriptional regulator [Sansalvadorimonas sp. 2012CJ34-2]
MTDFKTLNSTQIAKLAGVSRSTVSKVINNYPDIPEKTKDKVRSVIAEYRYTPNASAQVLRGKPQAVIALYVYAGVDEVNQDSLCGLSSPYVMGVISNFVVAANNRGHRLMIELLRHEEDEQEIEHRVREHFDSKSIAGAVFLGLPETVSFIDNLTDEDFPIAVIDREVNDHGMALNIFTDDRYGGEMATEHLIANGFRHLLFIGGDMSKRSARKRAEGYVQAMKKHGLTPELLSGDFTEQCGTAAAERILARDSKPDAVVCASDIVAYGLIRTLQKLDNDYLHKMGIIGFDGSVHNDFQSPPLSSVKVDFAAMARATISSLLNPDSETDRVIPVTLEPRASSLR